MKPVQSILCLLFVTLLAASVFSEGIASKAYDQSASKALQGQDNADEDSNQSTQSQQNSLTKPFDSSGDANFAPPSALVPEVMGGEMEFDISDDDFGDESGEFGDLTEADKRQSKFVSKRYGPRFVGKRYGPRFVGKRYGPRFVGKRYSPRFVGKRYGPRFVGKRYGPRFVGKRYGPRFVGKRYSPRFVGKREDETLNEDISNSHIIKKRSIWFSLPDKEDDTDRLDERPVYFDDDYDKDDESFGGFWFGNLDKRNAPRFVGKRTAPRFVGKRFAPRFVGKRFAVFGKRQAPRFVGKRDNAFDALDFLRYSLENRTSKRQAPRFVGKRNGERVYRDLLDMYARNEAINKMRANDKRWSTPVTPSFIGKRTINMDDFKR